MLRHKLGAVYVGDGRCRFCVWAPRAAQVDLHLLAPEDRVTPMRPLGEGYFGLTTEAAPGARYVYVLNGDQEFPDPASRAQPGGVHGPSQVVDLTFSWRDDAWQGLPLEAYVLYELHVGTFTAEGTLQAVIPRLVALKQMGVTALELMPLAAFPGDRNWGYDGVFTYAVHAAYGGSDGLMQLVDACHREGMGVVLDVVYNHLGPEGNVLQAFGPYLNPRQRTPWGEAINVDGPDSDHVRWYFLQNALEWVTQYHLDGLRLDSIHTIVDQTVRPFLQELVESVHARGDELGRPIALFAEGGRNAPRVIEATQQGGLGFDALWSDDFHHALHSRLTGERGGYYQDFGRVGHVAKALRDGFVLSGQPSGFWGRRHGASSAHLPAQRFVVFVQNHDHVGNRPGGERLTPLVGLEAHKLAAAVTFFSGCVPLLFMGEEYAEQAPFAYFTSHQGSSLAEAVRAGRRDLMESLGWPPEAADPQARSTYEAAKLCWELRRQEPHASVLAYYAELLRLRRTYECLGAGGKRAMRVIENEADDLSLLRRRGPRKEALAAFHFGHEARRLASPASQPGWRKLLDSADGRWAGPGSSAPERLGPDMTLKLPALSAVVYLREAGGG